MRIFEGDRLLGETKADQAGFFRFTLPALAPGRHALTTRVVDAAGNVVATSASITVTFTGGPATPKPTALGPSAPAKVTAAALTPGVGPAATAAITATKAVTVPPKEGAAAIAGAPIVLAGSATPGTLLRIYDSEALLGEAMADAKGQWSLLVLSLAPGQHTLTARVYGADGKLVSSSAVFIVTVTPPTGVVTPAPTAAQGTSGAAGAPAASQPPQITGPKPGAELSAISPVLLEGTAPLSSTVRIYDGEKLFIEVVAGSDGSWRVVLPPLTTGSHTFAVRILSPSGTEQVSSAPLTVTVKPAPTAAPASTAVAPAAGRPELSEPAPGSTVESGQPVFSGIAAANSIVRVYDGDVLLGETLADARGRWVLVSPFVLATGKHGVRAVSVGADGAEVAGESFELTIAAEATGMKPPVFVSSTGKAPSQAGLLQGVAPPGTLVTIIEGPKLLARVKADAGGRWQYALPTWTSAGQHTYSIMAAAADGAVVYRWEPITVNIGPAAQ